MPEPRCLCGCDAIYHVPRAETRGFCTSCGGCTRYEPAVTRG